MMGLYHLSIFLGGFLVALSSSYVDAVGVNPIPAFNRSFTSRQEGYNDVLNLLLSAASFTISTELIENTKIDYELINFIPVTLTATIGGDNKEDAVCDAFELLDSGEIRIYGNPLPNSGGNQRYEMSVEATGIGFQCEMLLRVIIDGLSGVQNDDDGTLIFNTKSEGLSVRQSIILSSPEFLTQTPISFSLGPSTVNPNRLTYILDDVLSIFDGVGGIDLTDQVQSFLEGDSSIVAEPVKEAIQGLISDLVITLGDFLIANPLTNIPPNSFLGLGGFFDNDANGVMDYLDTEAEEIAQLDVPEDELVNLINGNVLVDIFFPQGGDNELGLLSALFETFEIEGTEVSQNDATAILVALLSAEFDIGDIQFPLSLDILPIILTIINADDPGSDLVSGDQLVLFEDSVVSGDFGIDARIALTDIFLQQTVENSDQGIFDGIEFLSKYTAFMPGFRLGDFTLKGTVLLDLGLEITDNEYFGNFSHTFDQEILELDMDVTELVGQVSATLFMHEQDLFDLSLGPLLADPLECATSTLARNMILTGFNIEAVELESRVSGFTNVITNLVGDAVNVVLFSYKSLIPRALEAILGNTLLNPGLEVFDKGFCPEANSSQEELYNFSDGIFNDIIEFADEQFFEDAISFVVAPNGETSFDLVTPESNFNFGLDLFPIDGWFQKVELRIPQVSVTGITPPEVTFASLGLGVPEALEEIPQFIQVAADLGTFDDRVTLILDLAIDVSEAEPHNSATEEQISAGPPSTFNNTNQTNAISLELDFTFIKAFLEIHAHLTEYSVDSMPVGDVLTTSCWVSRLLPYGGWTNNINVSLLLAETRMSCDCGTESMLELQEVITDPVNYRSLNDELQTLVDSIVNILPDAYSPENFEFTRNNGELVCAGLDPIEREFDPNAVGESDNSVYGYIGVLALSMGFMFPFTVYRSASSRIKGRTNEKEGKQEKEAVTVTEEDEKEKQEKLKKFEVYKEQSKDRSEDVPMYRNAYIPKTIRLFLVLSLLTNLVLFLYGDLGVAVVISLVGQAFNAPISLPDLGSFSVITSTFDLFESGAIFLGILIFALAIFWPYFKLISLTLCFLSSPKTSTKDILRCRFISVKGRGKFLHFLDSFGKWSLIEVFFVVFLRTVFEIDVGSPRVGFLPDTDLYRIQLLIEPKPSFYTFVTAVVVSIFVSNVMYVYHEKIVRENANAMRDIIYPKEADQNAFVTMRLADHRFKVVNSAKSASPGYVFELTSMGKLLLNLLPFACVLITLVAASTNVVEVDYLGIVAVFLELEGSASTITFSIFSLAQLVYSKGVAEQDSGAVFLVCVFVFAQVIVPLLLSLTLLYALNSKFSVEKALRFKAYRSALSAWSAIEVFVLAIAVSVIEVPELAGYITGDSCDFLVEFMFETLEPLGFVNELDIRNTCFGVGVSVPTGGYMLVAAVFMNVATSLIIMGLFNKMLRERQAQWKKERRVVKSAQATDPADRLDPANKPPPLKYSPTVTVLKKLKIIWAYRDDDAIVGPSV